MIHRFTGMEPGGDFASWAGNKPRAVSAGSRRFDPSSHESVTERVRIAAQFGADLLERLTGFVRFDRITDLRVRDYHGWVYNLSTGEGWYDANGVIVSNCRCEIVGVFTEDWEPPDHVLAADALWR
ncbi:MAG: hypothetical protein LC799_31940, partial [Actinobacteria bacterium]|nr:hypothetical protein [Actinomycetota bacterium]